MRRDPVGAERPPQELEVGDRVVVAKNSGSGADPARSPARRPRWAASGPEAPISRWSTGRRRAQAPVPRSSIATIRQPAAAAARSRLRMPAPAWRAGWPESAGVVDGAPGVGGAGRRRPSGRSVASAAPGGRRHPQRRAARAREVPAHGAVPVRPRRRGGLRLPRGGRGSQRRRAAGCASPPPHPATTSTPEQRRPRRIAGTNLTGQRERRSLSGPVDADSPARAALGSIRGMRERGGKAPSHENRAFARAGRVARRSPARPRPAACAGDRAVGTLAPSRKPPKSKTAGTAGERVIMIDGSILGPVDRRRREGRRAAQDVPEDREGRDLELAYKEVVSQRYNTLHGKADEQLVKELGIEMSKPASADTFGKLQEADKTRNTKGVWNNRYVLSAEKDARVAADALQAGRGVVRRRRLPQNGRRSPAPRRRVTPESKVLVTLRNKATRTCASARRLMGCRKD